MEESPEFVEVRWTDSEVEPVLPILPSAWKRAFIFDLMQHGILVIACRNCNVRYRNVLYARKQDPDFDAYVNEAIELAKGDLEYRARLRALAGSDILMVKMLEANLPEKYGKLATPTSDIFVKAYIGFTPDAWDTAQTIDGKIVEKQPSGITDESERKTDSDLQAVTVAVAATAG